jgi:predicted TIM-barrel fold metal-dependent hydrolase
MPEQTEEVSIHGRYGVLPIAEYRKAELAPDPQTRQRLYTVISVDDHVVEPPHTFVGRLPRKFLDRAPRIIELEDGSEAWRIEDVNHPQIAMGAVVGRPRDQWGMEATRYSDIRPGCYDAAQRIKDMDIDGIYASMNFPSLVAGLGGATFYTGTKDAEFGLALVKAWNDWLYEEWAQPHPDRIIGCQVTWLGDPQLAAAEIRRNAARGFKAVTFVGDPGNLGLPSMRSGHWDPFLAACQETETVVCLHVGSDNWNASPAGAALEVAALCFPVGAYRTATDWLWGGVPSRFPGLKIALSEGGIGWVPMLLDRINYVMDHSGVTRDQGWLDRSAHPVEVFRRNFYFCAIEFAGAGIEARHKIGIDKIMVETDYPHADSTWPDSQEQLRQAISDFSPSDIRKLTWENASSLFRHAVPPSLQIPRI